MRFVRALSACLLFMAAGGCSKRYSPEYIELPTGSIAVLTHPFEDTVRLLPDDLQTREDKNSGDFTVKKGTRCRVLSDPGSPNIQPIMIYDREGKGRDKETDKPGDHRPVTVEVTEGEHAGKKGLVFRYELLPAK